MLLISDITQNNVILVIDMPVDERKCSVDDMLSHLYLHDAPCTSNSYMLIDSLYLFVNYSSIDCMGGK